MKRSHKSILADMKLVSDGHPVWSPISSKWAWLSQRRIRVSTLFDMERTGLIEQFQDHYCRDACHCDRYWRLTGKAYA